MDIMTLYPGIISIKDYPRYNCGEVMAHVLRGNKYTLDPHLMPELEKKLIKVSEEIKKKRKEYNAADLSSKGKISQEIKKLVQERAEVEQDYAAIDMAVSQIKMVQDPEARFVCNAQEICKRLLAGSPTDIKHVTLF